MFEGIEQAQIHLERGGEFDAPHMLDNSHKCAAMGTRSYRYEVKIEARATKLTPEGYVLNNEKVQEYFDRKFGKDAAPWEAMSCERMALTAAHEICEGLTNDGIKVIQVCVTLYGSWGAKITAMCSPAKGKKASSGTKEALKGTPKETSKGAPGGFGKHYD